MYSCPRFRVGREGVPSRTLPTSEKKVQKWGRWRELAEYRLYSEPACRLVPLACRLGGVLALARPAEQGPGNWSLSAQW